MTTFLIIFVPLVLGALVALLFATRYSLLANGHWGTASSKWWSVLTSHLWALLGNSKTIAVALAIEALALLDELKLLDWSSFVGTENGGRVAMIIAALMIPLRLITRNAVSFEPKRTSE